MPALFLGIFSKSTNKEGAIAGMLAGLAFTSSYIIYFKFINPQLDNSNFWIGSISPEGIGFIGMFVNFFIAFLVTKFFANPPKEVNELIQTIRQP